MIKQETLVQNLDTGTIWTVDEFASLSEMQENCPKFFNTKFGKREYFVTYRGCLIARHTVIFSNGPSRRTIIYAYVKTETDKPYLFHVSSLARDLLTAKKMIDCLLNEQTYSYNDYKA